MTWLLMIPCKKDILLVIIILFGCHLIFAQPTVPVFRHLTTSDGLSHNTVLSFCQDKEGFLWIGTMNGLNRYDGINFKEFRYYPRRYSISVNNILEDSLGNI